MDNAYIVLLQNNISSLLFNLKEVSKWNKIQIKFRNMRILKNSLLLFYFQDCLFLQYSVWRHQFNAGVVIASTAFMVESAIFSREAVVSGTFMRIFTGALNVFKRASKWPLIWSAPSRTITESSEQCSTFTNQFISLKGRHFA